MDFLQLWQVRISSKYTFNLNDQSTRKNTMKNLYVRKVHEQWSIFCFYGMLWIVVVFEIVAIEVGDFWNLENMNAEKFYKSFVLARKYKNFFRFSSVNYQKNGTATDEDGHLRTRHLRTDIWIFLNKQYYLKSGFSIVHPQVSHPQMPVLKC
jgi:hypothetical protein